MDEIIQQYRALGGRFRLAASAPELQVLETALGCVLPGDLRRLYADHDGDEVGGENIRLPLRLLPIAEVIETNQFVQDSGLAAYGLRLFWYDDNSNYAGLYVAGPLSGRVCFLNHEEADLSPVYRTLRSFLSTLLTGIDKGIEWEEFARDYPALGLLSSEEAAEDWDAAQMLRPPFEAAEDAQERINYAYSIMALTPPERTDSLIEYTYDADLYIQERACELLGRRKFEPAVGRLAEVAAMNIANAPMRARWALAEIGTPDALARLHKVTGK